MRSLKFTVGCCIFICKFNGSLIFYLTGAVAPLSLEGKRQWERVPGRESAWRLRANSYFWLPAAQLPFPANYFRNHFALILSLRLDPKVGVITFTIQSRQLNHISLRYLNY